MQNRRFSQQASWFREGTCHLCVRNDIRCPPDFLHRGNIELYECRVKFWNYSGFIWTSPVRVGAKQTVFNPFRDDIQKRRQVSVGDRGVLPIRPRNRWEYALLAHTLGKMRSCATGEHSNTEICIVVLKKYNYTGEIISGRKYIPHSQSLSVSKPADLG